jgi:iron-sulfur cluster repair protein YtfE (RIC family)
VNEYDRPHTALQQLIAVHNHFRHYQSTLQSAIDPAGANGDDPVPLLPLDDLRAHCLYFCGGLTTHHTIEDRQWFPVLRQQDPSLGPVIDRLEAEHHKVAEYLEQIARAATALSDANGATLAELRTELSRLATDLLTHLSYEEVALAEALTVPYEPH